MTATRREERLLDVPVSTSVLSGAPLDVLGTAGQDIRQLAFAVPSLNIESSNGRTFPRFYIRGYGNTDFTSFASQPVGLYYDDIVQENPALKGFPIFDQADVEVLRGPQGTLFGRNSPAGVVKLESAKPVLGQFSGSASISDGTYQHRRFRRRGQSSDQRPDGVSRLDPGATPGQLGERTHEPSRRPAPGGLRRLGRCACSCSFKPSDDFSALFNVHGRTLDGSARLFRANIITEGTNSLVAGLRPRLHLHRRLQRAVLQQHRRQRASDLDHAGLHLSVDHRLRVDPALPDALATSTAATVPACSPTRRLPQALGYIPFAVETGGGIVSHYQLTQEFRVVSNQSGPLQGQAGVFLFDENTEAIDNDYVYNSLALIDTTLSRQKNDAEAIFGSLEYSFTSAFKVRGGLRFTWDNKTFSVPFTDVAGGLPPPLSASAHATKLNWDLSPTYALAPNVNLYARVATGFRAPSFGRPRSRSAAGTGPGRPVRGQHLLRDGYQGGNARPPCFGRIRHLLFSRH